MVKIMTHQDWQASETFDVLSNRPKPNAVKKHDTTIFRWYTGVFYLSPNNQAPHQTYSLHWKKI